MLIENILIVLVIQHELGTNGVSKQLIAFRLFNLRSNKKNEDLDEACAIDAHSPLIVSYLVSLSGPVPS